MANVSQSTETPKLGSDEIQICDYEDRILDIYPNQDVIDETYPRIYSAGKMVETLLLLESNQTAICMSERELLAMYHAQSELMQIIPTDAELWEMIKKARFLKKCEADIKQVFDQHLGWVSTLLKSFNAVSESVGEFAKNLDFIAEQTPETVAKGAFLDKLPKLKEISQKAKDLVNKTSEKLAYQVERYNKRDLHGITTYIPD